MLNERVDNQVKKSLARMQKRNKAQCRTSLLFQTAGSGHVVLIVIFFLDALPSWDIVFAKVRRALTTFDN